MEDEGDRGNIPVRELVVSLDFGFALEGTSQSAASDYFPPHPGTPDGQGRHGGRSLQARV